MNKKINLIAVAGSLLCSSFTQSADVYEIHVENETHAFTIDAATFGGMDFSPDKFSPNYGSGELTFALNGKNNVIKFELSKENLLQIWHDKTELRLLFQNEKSFKYDKVHGDDIILRIIATSKDGSNYEGNYSLELEQYGLENKVRHEGVIQFKRIFRYHE